MSPNWVGSFQIQDDCHVTRILLKSVESAGHNVEIELVVASNFDWVAVTADTIGVDLAVQHVDAVPG